MKYLTEERFIVNSNDKQSLKNYRDNYDRIFGEKTDEPAEPKDTDAIEMRFVTITHFCKVCEALVPDPENHQHHAVINDVPRYNCTVCCDTGCVVDKDRDPTTFVTEADGLTDCPACAARGIQLP